MSPTEAVREDARDVDHYLAGLPETRQAALIRLRTMCREELTGFAEELQYGMPCYVRAGVVEAGFASQKRYISIYILRTDVVKGHAEALAGQDTGKGCLRYRNPQSIDFDLVRSLLAATAASTGPVC
jgi:uncharacterized protein YdhG (YjbR/CyaY superfamily)